MLLKTLLAAAAGLAIASAPALTGPTVQGAVDDSDTAPIRSLATGLGSVDATNLLAAY